MFSATLTTVQQVSTRVKYKQGYNAETKDKKLETLTRQLIGKKEKKVSVVDLTTVSDGHGDIIMRSFFI